MSKLPSPCIDVCKFKHRSDGQDHCIGCSMTKAQKKSFKALKKEKHREAFLTMLVAQQSGLGQYGHWTKAYQRKCRKKGVIPTFIG
ncbi:MAG: DUF1289 domain-containing protein [Pseudomonadota bacterium]